MFGFGSWGSLVFRMSTLQMLSFSGMQRTVGYRHPTVDVLDGKAQSQYTGEELEDVTFELHFAAELGVSPRREADRIEEMARRGESHPLILGGRPVGRNEYVITRWPQEWRRFEPFGKLVEMAGAVTFQEFVPPTGGIL